MQSIMTNKGLVCVGDTLKYDFGTGPITLRVTIIDDSFGDIVFRGEWSDGDKISHIHVEAEILEIIPSGLRPKTLSKYTFKLFTRDSLKDPEAFLNEKGAEGWRLAAIDYGCFIMEKENANG